MICSLKNLAYDIQHQSLTRVEMQLEDIPILIRLTFLGFFPISILDQPENKSTDQILIIWSIKMQDFETKPVNQVEGEITLYRIFFDSTTF